eukprot:TRINITY_DN24809_c0_g4_i1.p1 TRINITY_DN24809_c0_g4~~TRINITY_DN24809_c0_g4_i1.p1  ORF type:complete len:1369 (+),score=331.55 TRINITY_DN24809_c0_g4_i1:102-4208(+)
MTESVKVAVRVRPFSTREKELDCKCAVSMEDRTTTVVGPPAKHFTFDASYWSHDDEQSPVFVSQQDIMQAIGLPILSNALQGYNGCLFAYGQTGSGKTYSVFGNDAQPGVVPRMVNAVFEQKAAQERDPKKQLRIWVSYTQIYNDLLNDLFAVGKGKSDANLSIHDHPKLGVHVPGLEEVPCETAQDVHRLLAFGTKKRAMAATRVHDYSSRSHAIVTIKLQCLHGDTPAPGQRDGRTALHARINIIDLAGSERQSKVVASGQLLKESCAINKGLSALALVIKELAERQSKGKNNAGSRSYAGIAFRASKLTWLLKDSLAGNSKTHMLANISPACESVSETLSTLRFASSVKTIRTVAVQNKCAQGDLVRSLRRELDMLRAKVKDGETTALHKQEQALKDMLQDYEKQVQHAKEQAKDREAALEDLALSQEEIDHAFGMDRMTPCLLNMSNDATLAGCLLYYVPCNNKRTIGSASDNAIQVDGLAISEHLCVIENADNKVLTITKCGKEGRVLINGKTLHPEEPQQLKNGQTLCLGRNMRLRVSLPLEEDQSPLHRDDTNLLLQNLEDDLDGIDDSPSWIALREYLDQVVQIMPREQAEQLVNDVRRAVAMADEAGELTDVCRPESGIRFEVRLTSGSPPSIVVCLLQAKGGENPTQAGLPVYHWSMDQMRARLDRMQDCYHSIRNGGMAEMDDLDDPWQVVNPAEIWTRFRDLQVRLEDQEQLSLQRECRREGAMVRGLMLWRGSRCADDLHVFFNAWSHQVGSRMRSRFGRRLHAQGSPSRATGSGYGSARNSTAGQRMAARSSMRRGGSPSAEGHAPGYATSTRAQPGYASQPRMRGTASTAGRMSHTTSMASARGGGKAVVRRPSAEAQPGKGKLSPKEMLELQYEIKQGSNERPAESETTLEADCVSRTLSLETPQRLESSQQNAGVRSTSSLDTVNIQSQIATLRTEIAEALSVGHSNRSYLDDSTKSKSRDEFASKDDLNWLQNKLEAHCATVNDLVVAHQELLDNVQRLSRKSAPATVSVPPPAAAATTATSISMSMPSSVSRASSKHSQPEVVGLSARSSCMLPSSSELLISPRLPITLEATSTAVWRSTMDQLTMPVGGRFGTSPRKAMPAATLPTTFSSLTSTPNGSAGVNYQESPRPVFRSLPVARTTTPFSHSADDGAGRSPRVAGYAMPAFALGHVPMHQQPPASPAAMSPPASVMVAQPQFIHQPAQHPSSSTLQLPSTPQRHIQKANPSPLPVILGSPRFGLQATFGEKTYVQQTPFSARQRLESANNSPRPRGPAQTQLVGAASADRFAMRATTPSSSAAASRPTTPTRGGSKSSARSRSPNCNRFQKAVQKMTAQAIREYREAHSVAEAH